MSFANQYLAETALVVKQLDRARIDRLANTLAQVRHRGGRLFFLGVGGSAANASHAVNDFRKIAAFEAYTPSDNVAELTAWTNDQGWESSYAEWLKGSRLNANDAIVILSVGGGSLEQNTSTNLVRAIQLAKSVGATVTGIVGRDGGATAAHADVCVIVPTVDIERVTPHTESFQMVILHLLVSHPMLKRVQTHWESKQQNSGEQR